MEKEGALKPSPPGPPARSGFVSVRYRGSTQPINLYYELYGDEARESQTRVMFIMGLAATGSAWAPQIQVSGAGRLSVFPTYQD